MTLLIDQNFTNFLKKNVQGFNEMKAEHQQNLVQLLMTNSTTDRFEHRDDPKGFYMPAEKMDKMFGRSSFNEVMNGLTPILLYRTGDYSAELKKTYAYRITEEAFKLIDGYLTSHNSLGCLLFKQKAKKTVRKVPMNAIQSRDKNENKVKTTFDIKADQRVDVDTLKQLQHELEQEIPLMRREKLKSSNKTGSTPTDDKATDKSLDKAKRMLSQVRYIIQFANNNVVPGSLIQQYTEAKSGRLYGEGVHHLQNAMKRVRNAALSGLYDYDIENCHFALLDQMAHNGGYECSTIRYYLKNKRQVREEIANDIGISVDKAKTCLIAMLYGSVNLKWHGASIPQEIGLDKASELDHHSDFKGLKNDVKHASKAVVASARKHQGLYMNAMGKGISTTKTESKVLGHLLQGMEAKILNIVGEIHSENIVLLQHDGWVTKKPIDRKTTENKIYEATCMRISLSEDVIDPEINICRNQSQVS